MAAVPIYLDFLSPYAYLAWMRARRLGLELAPKPVLFSALLNHWGQLGPAEIPSKRATTIRDVMRRAVRYQLPLVWPPRHPFSTVAAARVVLAAGEFQPANAEGVSRLVDELFAAAWVRGESLELQNVIGNCVARAGLDAELLALANGASIKQRLYDANAEALDRGVFGVPSFLVDDELFFGDDQLDNVVAKLAGADVLNAAEVAAAIALPSGLVRKRPVPSAQPVTVPAAGKLVSSLGASHTQRILEIFQRAPFVAQLGIVPLALGDGRVTAALPLGAGLRQQHGIAHAGVVTTLADHTAGACAATARDGLDVLSIEFKVNLLAPADAPWLVCHATTLRAGRRIAVVEAEVFAVAEVSTPPRADQLVAKASVTLSLRQISEIKSGRA